MATSWDEINSIFFDKIEEDGDFFSYYNLTDEEGMALAETRADSCLKEAAASLALRCESDVNFADFDEILRQFNFDATAVEKQLLASLQFEAYMARDIAKLKVWQLNFTPNDMQVFSPNESRRTFMQLYESVKLENNTKVDAYNARNRADNTRRYIDYASYDE